MYAEDAVVDDGREGQPVENRVARLPHVLSTGAAPNAFIVEAKVRIDLPVLVVAAQQRDALGVQRLQRE